MDKVPRVGVVVIGRNEGERLAQCLLSIDVVGAPVVYVDSASTDGSRELARGQGVQVIELDLKTPFTAARARNAGLAALLDNFPDIDYVQFVDGDCEFEQGWIATAVAFLDGEPAAAVACGRRRERFPHRSVFNRVADAEWDTPMGSVASCGGDALIRRHAVEGAGGYNPALLAGEEPELCHRLRVAGWKVWRLDQPMTIHDIAMVRFRQWWLRAVRSGMGYAQAWWLTRQDPSPLYRREILRALSWTGGLFGLALAAALLLDWRLIALLPVAWTLQYLKLAWRHGPSHGGLLLIGKVAETVGIGRAACRAITGTSGGTIFYR